MSWGSRALSHAGATGALRWLTIIATVVASSITCPRAKQQLPMCDSLRCFTMDAAVSMEVTSSNAMADRSSPFLAPAVANSVVSAASRPDSWAITLSMFLRGRLDTNVCSRLRAQAQSHELLKARFGAKRIGLFSCPTIALSALVQSPNSEREWHFSLASQQSTAHMFAKGTAVSFGVF